uniref:SUEL-type lectin domain-containing protein n=1 Tax=Neolamprologus brichardi TaxID=32507 RepID=A0A3Q4H251_NEOBR
ILYVCGFSGLLAATCLLSGADASMEKAVTCHMGVVQRLSCGTMHVYTCTTKTCSEGRPQQQLNNTKCSQQGTVDVLKRRCDGRKVCELSVTDVQSPDPCVDTYKYLETSYTCLPASHLVTCEHSFAHLHCGEGQAILVYGAHYGRHDQTTCSYRRPASQVQDVYCSRPTSKVAESCNGKSSCTIRASNSVFGDPCVGTYKYLEVAYICQCKQPK